MEQNSSPHHIVQQWWIGNVDFFFLRMSFAKKFIREKTFFLMEKIKLYDRDYYYFFGTNIWRKTLTHHNYNIATIRICSISIIFLSENIFIFILLWGQTLPALLVKYKMRPQEFYEVFNQSVLQSSPDVSVISHLFYN